MAESGVSPDLIIDARGLPCPMPLLKLKQALHGLNAGNSVQLIASDPNSKTDILRFCQIAGHHIQFNDVSPQQFEFLIIKASS